MARALPANTCFVAIIPFVFSQFIFAIHTSTEVVNAQVVEQTVLSASRMSSISTTAIGCCDEKEKSPTVR